MKKIFFAGMLVVATPSVVFAQGVVDNTKTVVPLSSTIVDPGLIPGDFFYFFDRLSETLDSVFTFNKEKKARLYLEQAKERVAEMQEVAKNSDVTFNDVASLKVDFDSRITSAVLLVKDKKEAGDDVSMLAKEIDEELSDSRDAVKEVLKEFSNKNSYAEVKIREKIAELAGTDASQIAGLTQALESLEKEHSNIEKELRAINDSDLDEENILEEMMSDDFLSEKHQEQEQRMREHFDDVDNIRAGDELNSGNDNKKKTRDEMDDLEDLENEIYSN